MRSLHPKAESLPYPQDGRPRRQIYREMVDCILAELHRGLRVCAVFYGHPGVLTRASHEAILAARSAGLSAQMLPGVSALDCLYADLGIDPGQAGCQIYETTDFLVRGCPFDAYTALVLCQIGVIGNLGAYALATPEAASAASRSSPKCYRQGGGSRQQCAHHGRDRRGQGGRGAGHPPRERP